MGLAGERTGEIAATIGAGVEALHDSTTRFVPAAVLGVVAPVVVFGVVAVLDPWSTLILAFTGPMLVLLLAVIGGRTRALTERRFDELGWLSAFYLDMVRGLGTLKAFRRRRTAPRPSRTSAGASATPRWRCCAPPSRRRS